MFSSLPAQLFIVTGYNGTGKTTLCTRLVQLAQTAGWEIRGILSPAVFENGQKTGIVAIDLATHQQQNLAVLRKPDTPTTETQTNKWLFNPQSIVWGNTVLQTAIPCDLLVVDELGPLEFEQNRGWTAGFSTIDSGCYKIGVIVIRPSLLGQAQRRWQKAKTINLNNNSDINTVLKIFITEQI